MQLPNQVILLVCMFVIVTAAVSNVTTSEGDKTSNNTGCVWSGTSPFCQGGCSEVNTYVKETSSKGDGVECLSGIKVLCCPIGKDNSNNNSTKSSN